MEREELSVFFPAFWREDECSCNLLTRAGSALFVELINHLEIGENYLNYIYIKAPSTDFFLTKKRPFASPMPRARRLPTPFK
jgi:hypothetical protein